MNQDAKPHIGELVSLLNRFAPNELARLTAENPEIQAELTPGRPLGAKDGKAFDLQVTIKMAAFAKRALETAKDQCVEAVHSVQSKIIMNQRMRLISHLLTAASTSGAIVAILKRIIGADIVLTCIALASSFVSIYADFGSGTLIKGVTAEKSFRELAVLQFEVQLQIAKLEALLETPRIAELKKETNAANELARKVIDKVLPTGAIPRTS